MKTRHIKEYLYKTGFNTFSTSLVTDILFSAFEDEVTELVMSKDDFKHIKMFALYNGLFNWDLKTCWGMILTVEK